MKEFIKKIEWLFAYFLIFAVMGWIWEVIYKFYRYHVFVNRGMNHLPWLPIYGFGALILLTIYVKIKKKNPIKIFLLSAILWYLFRILYFLVNRSCLEYALVDLYKLCF